MEKYFSIKMLRLPVALMCLFLGISSGDTIEYFVSSDRDVHIGKINNQDSLIINFEIPSAAHCEIFFDSVNVEENNNITAFYHLSEDCLTIVSTHEFSLAINGLENGDYVCSINSSQPNSENPYPIFENKIMFEIYDGPSLGTNANGKIKKPDDALKHFYANGQRTNKNFSAVKFQKFNQ